MEALGTDASKWRIGQRVGVGILGGAKVILATASSNRSMGPLLAGLSTRGRLIVVGASLEPIEVDPIALIFGGRSIEGRLTGSAIDGQDTLSFSVLENVRPIIETMPLERVAKPASAWCLPLASRARPSFESSLTSFLLPNERGRASNR